MSEGVKVLAWVVFIVAWIVASYRIGWSDGYWQRKHEENMEGFDRLKKRLRNRGATNG